MNWKETVISALNKGDVGTALKTAVTVNPEELFSLVESLESTLDTAEFLHELGLFYYYNQEFISAERAFKKAFEHCQILASDNPVHVKEAAHVLTNLGILYNTAGRFLKAEKAFKKAVTMVQSKRSEMQLDAALISINLGHLYQNTQRFEKAEIVYKKALETLRMHAKKAPEYTGDVALVLMNLGLLYWHRKRFSQAEKVYTEALGMYRRLTHENAAYAYYLATTLNNLGILYQNTQRFTKAETAHKEALTLFKNLEKTPDVCAGIADAFSNLGNLYWLTKQFDKAEKAFKESLEMRRALFEKTGGYALDVVMALTNVGNVYKDMQNFSEAENTYTEALKMSRELAEQNPDGYTPCVGLVLNNLGILYHDTKQIDKAEKVYTEALAIRRELAEKNPDVYLFDVAMTLNNVGRFYRNVGRYSESEQAYKEALQYYRRVENQSPDIAKTLNNLGVLYGDMQEFLKAESVFKEALKMYKQLEKDTKDALDTAGTLRNLGNLYRDAKRFDKAELLYDEALDMYKRFERKDPAFTPHVASVLNDIGIFYQDTRRFYEAEQAYTKALERRMDLVKRNPKAYAVDLAGTWNNLGILYNDAHLYGEPKFEKAEAVYRKALETFEQFKGEYPAAFAPYVAGMLHNLGVLLTDTERFEEAEEMHKRALELRIKLAEENPEVYTREVADSLTSLGILYEKMGKMEAEEYYKEAFKKYKELGLWFDAANTCHNLSQVKTDKKILDKARKLIEMGILFSREEKYMYAQKGTYEPLYWGLLEEDVSSFSVLEVLRDPALLSLPWGYILTQQELEKAQNDVEFQKRLVGKILETDIPAVTILEGLPKHSLFVYVQNLRDYVLFFVVGDSIQRVACEKEFLTLGDKLLFNLRIQQGAAQKTDDLTFVTEKFDDLSSQWSALLPEEIKELIQENDCIIFSPDSYCSYFPLEALQVDGIPLCLEKTVVRATSLHQFSTLLKRNPSFDSSLLVGNPWTGIDKGKLIYSLPSGSERFEISFLEGAQEEAEALTEKLPDATVLLGQNATSEKFLSEISRHSLIHFSGHGSLGRILFFSGPFKGFPPSFEPEEFSDLRKAERKVGTKPINMMEEWHPVTDLDLFDVPLTEGAVIFLNACETGQHKYAGGGYYQGLPAVFLKNGAHSVVSSLIPIFDNPSKEVALHFYENLLDTQSVTEALKKARIWAESKYEAHIYWVPYIHYGPPL